MRPAASSGFDPASALRFAPSPAAFPNSVVSHSRPVKIADSLARLSALRLSGLSMQLLNALVARGLITEADQPRAAEAVAAAPGQAPRTRSSSTRASSRKTPCCPSWPTSSGWSSSTSPRPTIEPDALAAMPQKLVHRKNLMPVARNNGTLVVATGDPFDAYALDELQTLTGLHVQPVLAPPREIARLIKAHFGVGGDTVAALGRGGRGGRASSCSRTSRPTTARLAKQAQEASVVRLVNQILDRGRQRAGAATSTSSRRRRASASATGSTACSRTRTCRRRSTASSRPSSAGSRSWPG